MHLAPMREDGDPIPDPSHFELTEALDCQGQRRTLHHHDKARAPKIGTASGSFSGEPGGRPMLALRPLRAFSLKVPTTAARIEPLQDSDVSEHEYSTVLKKRTGLTAQNTPGDPNQTRLRFFCYSCQPPPKALYSCTTLRSSSR